MKPTFVNLICILFISMFIITFSASIYILNFVLPFNNTVVIESRESKNNKGIPVLNRITYRKNISKNEDLWLMEQSHDDNAMGTNSEFFNDASFVSIAVDTTKSNKKGPMVAFFREHKPARTAALVSENQKNSYPWPDEKKYSIACALCHSNGPRLIRPNWNSTRAPLTFAQKVMITLWNFKIKTYGPIQNKGYNGLHMVGNHWKKELTVTSCVACHKSELNDAKYRNRQQKYSTLLSNFIPRFLTRNALTRENFLSIQFLINENAMPPPLHSFSQSDRDEILRFLN